MADSSDDFFYKNCIDTSSDESDDGIEVVVTVTLLAHDHEENHKPFYRGSLPGRNAALNHNRNAGEERLFLDYFHRTNPVFKENLFRHRIQMSRKFFTRILHGVVAHDN
jgi:hypothetical protein